MELKDFIKNTIRELSEAIDESGVELKKKVALTNTELRKTSHGKYGLIEFDLAVSASESKTGSGGGGVKIAVLEAKAGKSNISAKSSTSRIKFTVEADLDSYQAQVEAKALSEDQLKPKKPQVLTAGSPLTNY